MWQQNVECWYLTYPDRWLSVAADRTVSYETADIYFPLMTDPFYLFSHFLSYQSRVRMSWSLQRQLSQENLDAVGVGKLKVAVSKLFFVATIFKTLLINQSDKRDTIVCLLYEVQVACVRFLWLFSENWLEVIQTKDVVRQAWSVLPCWSIQGFWMLTLFHAWLAHSPMIYL